MEFNHEKSANYWKNRILDANDELSSVLYFSGSEYLNKNYDLWEKRILDLELKEGYKNILDWPCGNGRHTHFLEERSEYLTSIDINEEIIHFAKEKSTKNNSEFLIGNIEDIIIKEKYDVIVCTGLFEHLPMETIEKYLKKVSNILNPNGKFILVINNSYSELLKDGSDNEFRKSRQLNNGYYCSITNYNKIHSYLKDNRIYIKRIYSNPCTTVLRHLDCEEELLWELAVEKDLKYFNNINQDIISDHLFLVCQGDESNETNV